MRTLCSIAAGMLLLIALPTASEAQGWCFLCNEDAEINPCEGVQNGYTQCAQPAPGKCDNAGNSCHFGMLEVAPDGTLRTGEPAKLAQVASPGTLELIIDGMLAYTVRRNCGGQVLERYYTLEASGLKRASTKRLKFASAVVQS